MSNRPAARDAAVYGDELDTTRTVLVRLLAGAGLARPASRRSLRLGHGQPAAALLVGVAVPVLAISAWWARAALRMEVEGPSMLPTLAPGDRLLVARKLGPGRGSRLRVGDLVVLGDPEHPARLLVKRVEALGDASVVVAGDNRAASRDSRDFGAVSSQLVVGRAWYRYWPTAAAGGLRRVRAPHR
jgi:nickel-type superoxide dismutase maturation protease